MSLKNRPADFERSLRRTARQLPAEPLPSGMEERFFERLAAEAPSSPLPSARIVSRRRALRWTVTAVAAAAATGAVLIAGPRLLVRPTVAAEMHRAIRSAQTWHFSGWRLQNGKQVPWEVWGQRAPFRYRERIGDDILFDDGARRVRLLPPDPRNGRENGVVLTLPSEPLGQATAAVSDARANFLVGIGGDRADLRVDEQRDGFVTLIGATEYANPRNRVRETTTVRVSASRHLPVGYEVRRDTIGRGNASSPSSEVVAHLDVIYDQPLPADVAVPPVIPAGWATADLSAANLDVRATAVGQSATGDVHLSLAPEIGGKAFRQKTVPLGVFPDGGIGMARATDDRGTVYLVIGGPPQAIIDTETPDLWLTPLSPRSPGEARPTRLRVTIPVRLERYERMGDSGRTVPIFEKECVFDIPLPAQVTSDLGWEAARAVRHHGIPPTLDETTAQARALFHGGKGSASHSVRTPDGGFVSAPTPEALEHLRQSVAWWNAAAAAAERSGNRSAASRYRLSARSAAQILDRATPPR